MRGLETCGLDVVRLVMSDAQSELKKAIGTVFQSVGWWRCRVHFMRKVLAVVLKASQDMVASIIGTILAQPDRVHILNQFGEVPLMLGRLHPNVATMLTDPRKTCPPSLHFQSATGVRSG